jgi:hypothetical protein
MKGYLNNNPFAGVPPRKRSTSRGAVKKGVPQIKQT